jgi:hypothetical protein
VRRPIRKAHRITGDNPIFRKQDEMRLVPLHDGDEQTESGTPRKALKQPAFMHSAEGYLWQFRKQAVFWRKRVDSYTKASVMNSLL